MTLQFLLEEMPIAISPSRDANLLLKTAKSIFSSTPTAYWFLKGSAMFMCFEINSSYIGISHKY